MALEASAPRPQACHGSVVGCLSLSCFHPSQVNPAPDPRSLGLRGAQWTLGTELVSLSFLSAGLCWTQGPQVTKSAARVQTNCDQGQPHHR